uniref:Pentapeptide repeat-containing protein n=1 Tax=Fundulus heteroclitus TaxID=8078 RepID=A0A3Q2PTH1_FUNHE
GRPSLPDRTRTRPTASSSRTADRPLLLLGVCSRLLEAVLLLLVLTVVLTVVLLVLTVVLTQRVGLLPGGRLVLVGLAERVRRQALVQRQLAGVQGDALMETGSDLTGSDLTGSDLTGSDLTGSDLTGSNLTGSDLTGSNLTGGDLTGSNLTGSDLTGSDLTGSDLTGSDLTGNGARGTTFDKMKRYCLYFLLECEFSNVR